MKKSDCVSFVFKLGHTLLKQGPASDVGESLVPKMRNMDTETMWSETGLKLPENGWETRQTSMSK